MARLALVLGLVAGLGCAPARSKAVGHTTMGMAIGGVVLIIASAAVATQTTHSEELMVGGSVMSAAGILGYAAHELSGPEIVYREESPARKHARWARILTEHAAGAARDGNCARVRKFEPRVRVYDADYHDFVFMRDPEILRCLTPATVPVEETVPSDAAE